MRTLTLLSFLRTLAAASTCLLLLFQVASANPDPALAKPSDPKAREYIARGNKLYKVGEVAKAVEEYKAGALVQDAPVFYFNLGQCYRQLGLYKEAIWQYERFLASAKPRAQLKEAVEGFLVQMKAELEKKARSQPPLEAAPDPQQTSESRRPTPAPQQATPAPRSQQLASSVSDNPVRHGPAAPWYKDTWGWGIVSSGVVAASVSGFLFVSASRLRDDLNTEAIQERRDDLSGRIDTRQIAGAVVGIGGCALIAIGVVKLVRTDTVRAPTTAWQFGVHRHGVALFGRF